MIKNHQIKQLIHSRSPIHHEGIPLLLSPAKAQLLEEGRYVAPLPNGRSYRTASLWSAWFHIADAEQTKLRQYKYKNTYLLNYKIFYRDLIIKVNQFLLNSLSFLLFFWIIPTYAQENQDHPSRELMSKLFDSDVTLDWIKDYSGLKNNLFPFTMVLGRAGEEIKGWYFYHPDEIFYVGGAWNGNNLWLDEWYKEGEECGHFIGQFDENRFTGTWSNIEKNMMSSCSFVEVSLEPIKPSKKTSIIQFYTDQDDALQGKWTIWTDHEGIFHGTFINRQRSLYQIRLIRAKTNDSGKSVFKVACIGEDFQIAHTIWIEPWNKIWYYPDKPELTYKLSKFKVLQESALETKIDFHWMVAHTALDFVDKHTSALAIYRDTTCNLVGRKRLSPEFRSNQYRSSTFLPLIYEKSEVSGLLTVQSVSTQNTCSSTLPISYKDRQEKDPLDGLMDKVGFMSDFQDHVSKQLTSNKQSFSNPYLKDIKPEEFKYFLLFEGGLLAARPFDSLHGVLWIRVPDRLIDTYFDKKSLAYKYSTSKI
jgi:hypothetical protein